MTPIYNTDGAMHLSVQIKLQQQVMGRVVVELTFSKTSEPDGGGVGGGGNGLCK